MQSAETPLNVVAIQCQLFVIGWTLKSSFTTSSVRSEFCMTRRKYMGMGYLALESKICRFMMVPGRHSIGEFDICGDSAAKNAINSHLYFMECQ